jgi:formate dehydrogenase
MLDVVRRGGRIAVVDPRRTETAERFEHVPIRPGADPYLLAGMLKVILDEGREDRAALARQTVGAESLRTLVASVELDVVEAETGVPRDTITALARDLAGAPAGFVYGRCGASLGRFSTLTKYLIDVLNVVTGNLDRPGGMIFPDPYLNVEVLTKLVRMKGYDRWRTRVDGIPEVFGSSPLATLPREAMTPGPGQLRAMIAVSTNMATTSPASKEMERALRGMDLFVSLDPYLTETSSLADYVLPPTLLYEREGFPLFGQLHYTVPNASWTDAITEPPPGTRDDWWILDEICKRIGIVPSPAPGAQLLGRLGIRPAPHVGVDLAIRLGKHGDLFGLRPKGLSRKKLMRRDGAIKLADAPGTGTLRKKVHTKDRKVHLDHDLFRAEMMRLLATPTADAEHPLRLFTVRELRSQNSWLHNVPKLMAGGRACRLRIHPADAASRGIADGAAVEVASRWGEIEVVAQVTDEVMRGSVGLPQHWGHKGGWKVAVAAGGGRYNDLVPNDPELLDVASGNAWINGIGVEARPVNPTTEKPVVSP